MTHDLTGKVALVTGATRGIGRATAELLARHGATVVVSSRKAPAVEATVAAIRDAGGRAAGIPANVGRLEEARALVDRALVECGGIDILVNNAAANPVFGPVEETSPEAFAKIMDVNVRAPFELAKAVLPSMRTRGGGAIVNISSIGGVSPEPGLGIYSVSKAALVSLTKVMAREWGRDGVRANVICPGFIRTDFSQVLWTNEEVMAQVMAKQPIARLGEAEEVARLALYLAAPEASFCTGAVYMIDGGYTI